MGWIEPDGIEERFMGSPQFCLENCTGTGWEILASMEE